MYFFSCISSISTSEKIVYFVFVLLQGNKKKVANSFLSSKDSQSFWLSNFDLATLKTEQNCCTTSRRELHQTFVLKNNKYGLWEDKGYLHWFGRSVDGQDWALMKLYLLQRYLHHEVLDGRPSEWTAGEWWLQWTNRGKCAGQNTKSTESTVKHLCAQAWHKSNRNTQHQEVMWASTSGTQYEPKITYSRLPKTQEKRRPHKVWLWLHLPIVRWAVASSRYDLEK